MMSRPKGSNRIRFAKRVVRTYLLYSDGYVVEAIAEELGVTKRMVYYYLKAWLKYGKYYVKIAKQQGYISIRDEAALPD